MLSTGHGRKTDEADALSVGIAALTATRLNSAQVDEALAALRALTEHRDNLVRACTQTVNRLHALLHATRPRRVASQPERRRRSRRPAGGAARAVLARRHHAAAGRRTARRATPPGPPDRHRHRNSRRRSHGHRHHFSEELPVAIPSGYVLSAVHVDIAASTWTSGIGAQWVTVIANDYVQNYDAGSSGYVIAGVDVPIDSLPTQGTVAVAFRLKGIVTGELSVTVTATPADLTNNQWRQQAWNALRDKAYADYLANLDRLRQQRSTLVGDVNNTDTLTLRRMEREQVMRATLEWLFPGFGDAGSVLEGLPDPGSLDTASWQKVMQYGEYIKFVQSAIDWDNVLVLLFPYFWDTMANQQEKLLLSHPDPLHRDFLRAGAARVILAIQPGYEEDVVSLLQEGQFGALGQGTAFAKVVQDVRGANTAYGQTAQPTDGDSDNPGQPGNLIGSWHDYTPTSALDIDVTRFPVKDGTTI